MRTTLTLEPDVFQRLEQRTRAARITFKQAVNDTLRAGLNLKPAKKNPPFRVKAFTLEFRPEIDLNTVNFNHLADELEDEERIRKMRASSIHAKKIR